MKKLKQLDPAILALARQLAKEEGESGLSLEKFLEAFSSGADILALHQRRHTVHKPGTGLVWSSCDRKNCPLKKNIIKISSW